MKASTKTAFRLIKKHATRFITIIAIVLVSVGFMAGVGESDGKICTAAYGYYASNNIPDLYLKSSSPTGFTQEELDAIADKFGVDNVMRSFCMEGSSTTTDDETTGELITKDYRLYCYEDLENQKVNKLDVLEGRLPNSPTEIAVERETNGLKKHNIGDKITINYAEFNGALLPVEYEVVGIVQNPMHMTTDAEKSFRTADKNDRKKGNDLEGIYYATAVPAPLSVALETGYNDVYIAIDQQTRDLFEEPFCDGYCKEVQSVKTQLVMGLGIHPDQILTLNDNFGIYSLVNYANKIGDISIVFVVFFLLVTILVVYSTMSRLLTEERAQIACQKTLGYSDFRILLRYVAFVLMATAIGAILAFPLGYGLTRLLYSAFYVKYAMPAFPATVKFFYYTIVVALTVVATLSLVVVTGMRTVGNKPATLLTPKAPKSGKKVMLERIPILWNNLAFKHKSTLRNVLLFKSRFLMTVISIIGSAILVFCGLGVLDCTFAIPDGAPLKGIAAVLILFSAALCALVIYNLTNINVSERNREIATLMVLGYSDREVTGYIFREVYVMSFIGAVLGLPLGVAFISFVFSLIDFGTLAQIKWISYILAPCLVMFFSFLSTLMLKKKITKTDMNVSLKTID